MHYFFYHFYYKVFYNHFYNFYYNFFYNSFYNFYYNFFYHFYYNYYYGQFPQMEQVALLLQPAAPSPRNPAGTVITPLRPKPLMITITVSSLFQFHFVHVIK